MVKTEASSRMRVMTCLPIEVSGRRAAALQCLSLRQCLANECLGRAYW
jgi:hypothetical protein